MAYSSKEERERTLRGITELFTTDMREYFRELLNSSDIRNLSEIRLRAGLPSSITNGGKTMLITPEDTPLILRRDELEAIFTRLCGGSVYTQTESLKEGCILKDGVRIGVAGRFSVKDGKISGLSRVDSLSIRIPYFSEDAADSVLSLISREGFEKCGGILAVSPPGLGKTTFLRALARGLSRGISYNGTFRHFKVVLADERGELYNENYFSGCTVDRLELCPKAFAVECATALLSPEVIVCDEIRNEHEADLLLKAMSEGVILAASCHGVGLCDIMKKPHLKRLLDGGAFGTVYSISASNGGFKGSVMSVNKEPRPTPPQKQVSSRVETRFNSVTYPKLTLEPQENEK